MRSHRPSADHASRAIARQAAAWSLIAVALLTARGAGATPPPPDVMPTPTAPAAPASPPSLQPPDTPPPATETDLLSSTIELTRESARASTEWLARGVDSWFGDIPFSEGGKVRDGELGFSLFKRTDEPASRAFRFKATFRLPNLEARRYVFIGNDDRREVLEDRPDVFSRQQQLLRNDTTNNTFFAGIGSAIQDNIDVRLGFRGGLKPYGQARFRKSWQLTADDAIEFRETLFYSIADRLGSTTALTVEHIQTPSLAIRWINVLTATQHSRNTRWSSSLGGYQSMGEERVLALEAIWGGVIGDGVTVADYGIQTKWSQPIHGHNVLGDVIFGHFWPKPSPTEARSQAWAFGAGVRLKF